MDLSILWFWLIAGLWIGYFVLEGFDFGVGMLLWMIGRNDHERRAVLSTIGPVWDANEVWLIVAVGATFAAFPAWYASWTSAFYLPLLLILLALIGRNVAIEYRDKRPDPRWRRRADLAIMIGSFVTALLWGAIFHTTLDGLALDSAGELVGGVIPLSGPGLLGGLATVAGFLTHGAVFLSLKTDGTLRRRARAVVDWAGWVTVALTVGWLTGLMTRWPEPRPVVVVLAVITMLSLIMGLLAHRRGREGWAFVGTTVWVAAGWLVIFASRFPVLLPSTLDPAWSLTVTRAAVTPYTLSIISWGALISLPFVIGYQGWTYWVFRRRVTAPTSMTSAEPSTDHVH